MSKEKKFAKKWKKEVGPATTNPNSLWDRLEAIERELVVTKPEGTFRTKEYADHNGITVDVASNRLDRMAREGRIQKVKVPGSQVYWRLIG